MQTNSPSPGRIKLSIFTMLMLLVTGLLVLVASNPLQLSPFSSEAANSLVGYQLSALPVAGLALILTYIFAVHTRLGCLNLRRSGEMQPFTRRENLSEGLTETSRWESEGWVFTLAMTAVMSMFLGYFLAKSI